ncbi:MAG: hypothetical protein RLZZ127_296 [Planctomycetota bacterium]
MKTIKCRFTPRLSPLWAWLLVVVAAWGGEAVNPQPCKASTATSTVSKDIPELSVWVDGLASQLGSNGWVKSATGSAQAAVNGTKGEECCPDSPRPTEYVKLDAGADAQMAVQVAPPGETKGEYNLHVRTPAIKWLGVKPIDLAGLEVKWEISATSIVSATTSAGVLGRLSQCTTCVTGRFSGDFSVSVVVVATGSASLTILGSDAISLAVSGRAEAHAAASLRGRTTLIGDCNTSCLYGNVRDVTVDLEFKASAKVFKKKYNFSWKERVVNWKGAKFGDPSCN